jgi:hypothetical protein
VRAVRVEKNVYVDAVMLMRLSSQIKQLSGVIAGVMTLGTDIQKAALVQMGFAAADLAVPNDLLIAVEADGPSACETALTQAKKPYTGRLTSV